MQNGSGSAIYKADVVNFVSACPEVAASLVYLRTGTVNEKGELDNSAPTSTLSQVSLNEYSLPKQDTDAWFRWYSGALTTRVPSRSIKLGLRTSKHGPRPQLASITQAWRCKTWLHKASVPRSRTCARGPRSNSIASRTAARSSQPNLSGALTKRKSFLAVLPGQC